MQGLRSQPRRALLTAIQVDGYKRELAEGFQVTIIYAHSKLQIDLSESLPCTLGALKDLKGWSWILPIAQV